MKHVSVEDRLVRRVSFGLLSIALACALFLAAIDKQSKPNVECALCTCGNPDHRTCNAYCFRKLAATGVPREMTEKEQKHCHEQQGCAGAMCQRRPIQ
jgi:hypothetical protein